MNFPGEILARLADLQRSLRSTLTGEPIRWVRPEILHLTLRFLGEIRPERLETVLVAARSEAVRWPAFRLEVGGLGCFPDARRPRVLWIRAADPAGSVERIAADLERLARAAGLPAEKRGFTPHLTVARIREGLSSKGLTALASVLSGLGEARIGAAQIPAIHLMRSILRPTGPEYTPIAVLDLIGREGDAP